MNLNLVFEYKLKMDSNTDTDSQKQEEVTGDNKKASKKASKSKQKKAGKGKAGKKPKQPKQKQKKEAKQPKKKKPSKSKDKIANIEKDTETVRQYLEKQNRPYNLLNIFDNLHGSIKKPALEVILDSLVESQFLTCKQFGKNKVYFLNQSKFQIDANQIEKLGVDLTEARQQNSILQAKHKALIDEHRKLMAMKTQQQIEEQIQTRVEQICRLKAKKQKLMNGIESKVDEQTVIKAQKQQQKIRKDLKKYRGIKKDALSTWSQILEKKPAEVAEIMGLDI